MGLFSRKPKLAKFKGKALIAFNSEEERMEAAIDTFLWIKDYLESYSLNNDGTAIKDITAYFDSIPKEMKKLGMSDYQWKDFNRMLFWLVYDVSITPKNKYFTELNQRVVARMLQEKHYISEPVVHKDLIESEVDRDFIRDVIAAFDYQKTLCFNYWKFYE
ncbi:MAG: hypothetical protein IJQ67_04415 [Bacilli bacterium]|nr:hypothetical protein [Bacilli bacterium]